MFRRISANSYKYGPDFLAMKGDSAPRMSPMEMGRNDPEWEPIRADTSGHLALIEACDDSSEHCALLVHYARGSKTRIFTDHLQRHFTQDINSRGHRTHAEHFECV